MDKGALHAQKAHVETETDKVTQSMVALTERQSKRVYWLLQYLLSLSAPSCLFIEEQSTILLPTILRCF